MTGDTELILTMEPSETVAWYRRYTIPGLPKNCCRSGLGNTVQATAMAKFEFIPATNDQDYLLIQNIEALVEECQSVRFSGMDSAGSDQKAAVHHHTAIGLLKGEITHYLGNDKPAVTFAPFGSAKLQRQGIGRII